MNPVNFFSGAWANPFGWLALIAIPIGIVLLYFLKLKRQPLEVPSTYLWSRTIEDLHVNTIWQRLRQSLLLFLQLLLIALVILSCLRPGWKSSQLRGERFIFMIDTSASMSATDLSPSRLDKAKEVALAYVNEMKTGDAAMVISFSDVPFVEQPYTDNQRLLRERIRQIKPTNRKTDVSEALRTAAGLSNPGRTASDATDVQVADALEARIFLLTDGGFGAADDLMIALRGANSDDQAPLTLEYVPIGTENPANVGIVAFTTERNPEKEENVQAFAQFENHGEQEVDIEAELFLDNEFIDAAAVTIPGQDEETKLPGSAGVEFTLRDVSDGILKIVISHRDNLRLDNVAYAAINPPTLGDLLLVTPFNEHLVTALNTDGVRKLARVSTAPPESLETEEHQKQVASGIYDLVIYDRCSPTEMPQANTLFLGALPPGDKWKAGEKQSPIIIDIDRTHPLMQLVEMGNVNIVQGFDVIGPPGAVKLISTDAGSLLSIVPREGFEDAVMGMSIFDADENGSTMVNTDWTIRRSFPVFVMNLVRYLGGAGTSSQAKSIQPGAPMLVRADGEVKSVTIESPAGQKQTVQRGNQSFFVYNGTTDLGVYNVREGSGDQVAQRFSVNLFDSQESHLPVPNELPIANDTFEATAAIEPTRREFWKLILLLGLAVLLLEWYIYNKRVYL